jgi:hypothetical protein
MTRNTLLVFLTAAGSALCWWPAIIEPSFNFPRWILLALIALMTGVATILSEGYWGRFVVASVVGSFAGLCVGCALWPSSDGIAESYTGYVVIIATLVTAVVAVFATLIARKIVVSKANLRRVAWIVLVGCIAFGPVTLALTKPVIARRVERNERIAAQRFESLKSAVEQTSAESADPEHPCDGTALKRHYTGPPFNEEDWNGIAPYYAKVRFALLKRDGYAFAIFCRAQGEYRIDASPLRYKADGTRRFCADQSGTPCTK